MANYNDSLGFFKNSAAYPAKGNDRITSFAVDLDFAQIVAARSAAGATALVFTDTLKVIPLPVGTIILSAGVEVVEVESTNTTATVSVGFEGGSPVAANAYANAAPLNALGFTVANLANPTLVSGTTASTTNLAITLNTATPTDAKIRVFAVVADVSA
jgi:hypothetical protein